MDQQHEFPINDQRIIYQCIPQRPPMVMVDGLLEYHVEGIVATFTVNPDNIFLKNEYLQETGIIEHMAQSVALHTGFGYYLRREQAPIGYIGGISNLEIYQCPKVHQQIKSEVTILQEFSGVTLVEITSKVEQTIIATGQMKTVVAK
ncbi:MAG: hypothetical protein ACI35Z_14515 [Sphingobacterium hotanense]